MAKKKQELEKKKKVNTEPVSGKSPETVLTERKI